MKKLIEIVIKLLRWGRPLTVADVLADLESKAEQLHCAYNHHTDARVAKQAKIDRLMDECSDHDDHAEHCAAVADKIETLLGKHQ